jgi:hypothetical protein
VAGGHRQGVQVRWGMIGGCASQPILCLRCAMARCAMAQRWEPLERCTGALAGCFIAKYRCRPRYCYCPAVTAHVWFLHSGQTLCCYSRSAVTAPCRLLQPDVLLLLLLLFATGQVPERVSCRAALQRSARASGLNPSPHHELCSTSLVAVPSGRLIQLHQAHLLPRAGQVARY